MKLLVLFFLSTTFSFSVFAQKKSKICSKIEIEIDKFNNDTTYRSPSKAGYLDFVQYTLVNGVLYMSVKAPGSTVSVGKKGVVILLNNGIKIEKPEAEIETDVNASAGYDYTSFFRLNESDIKLLKENLITDIRLYIYDAVVREKQAERYKEYINCLMP